MGLNDTPSGERVHIGFFGRRNAGKSSLVNAVTGQELSVVSPTAGTTTDPVRKAMELLPLGPVVILDTPGFDDEGSLGQLREAAYFETWLTRILLNECHRELRRRKRLAGEEALPETAGPDAYDHLPLKDAVARLPEPLRAVVILRYFTGYTQSETAAALTIPQGTVATRQRRALELLRLELGEEGNP